MVYTQRTCRLDTKCSPRTVPEWIFCRISHGDETAADLAQRAQIALHQLRHFANDQQARPIPLLSLVRLCAVLGDWSVFDLVLIPHGYRLTQIEARAKSVIDEALDVAGSNGQVVASVHAALAGDGRIDVHEHAAIRQLTHDARRQLDELDAALAATAR